MNGLGEVKTIAGSKQEGYLDGMGSAAQFNHPRGISVDEKETIYVCDYCNQCIRQISAQGNSYSSVKWYCRYSDNFSWLRQIWFS